MMVTQTNQATTGGCGAKTAMSTRSRDTLVVRCRLLSVALLPTANKRRTDERTNEQTNKRTTTNDLHLNLKK